MSTAKQEALRLIRALPDDCTLADIRYHLDVVGRVREGLADIEAGRVVPHEEIKKRIAKSGIETREGTITEPWTEANRDRGIA